MQRYCHSRERKGKRNKIKKKREKRAKIKAAAVVTFLLLMQFVFFLFSMLAFPCRAGTPTEDQRRRRPTKLSRRRGWRKTRLFIPRSFRLLHFFFIGSAVRFQSVDEMKQVLLKKKKKAEEDIHRMEQQKSLTVKEMEVTPTSLLKAVTACAYVSVSLVRFLVLFSHFERNTRRYKRKPRSWRRRKKTGYRRLKGWKKKSPNISKRSRSNEKLYWDSVKQSR